MSSSFIEAAAAVHMLVYEA